MIKNYDLLTICIADLGFDPNFLSSYISPFTKKKALRMLEHIKNDLAGNNPAGVEFELTKAVESLSNNNRNKRFAIVLVMLAYENNMISGRTYDALRKQLGTNEYDDSTKEKLKGNWIGKEMQTDPFAMLEGTQMPSQSQYQPQAQPQIATADSKVMQILPGIMDMNKIVQEQKKESDNRKHIIDRKPYSDHPEDKNMEVVLARFDSPNVPSGVEFVTWVYNNSTDEYVWGHYFSTEEEARKDFEKRFHSSKQ